MGRGGIKLQLIKEELVRKAKPTVHYQGGSMKREIEAIFLLLQ